MYIVILDHKQNIRKVFGPYLSEKSVDVVKRAVTKSVTNPLWSVSAISEKRMNARVNEDFTGRLRAML